MGDGAARRLTRNPRPAKGALDAPFPFPHTARTFQPFETTDMSDTVLIELRGIQSQAELDQAANDLVTYFNDHGEPQHATAVHRPFEATRMGGKRYLATVTVGFFLMAESEEQALERAADAVMVPDDARNGSQIQSVDVMEWD